MYYVDGYLEDKKGSYTTTACLGRATNLNPMATCLQFTYSNLSLLFAHFHVKIMPWGHESQDFVELGFYGSDGEEEDNEEDEDMHLLFS